jgi:hypothetical protein
LVWKEILTSPPFPPGTQSYIANTLFICIFTTVVCGGVTERMLTKFGMKQPGNGTIDMDDGGNVYETLMTPDPHTRMSRSGSAGRIKEGIHGFWKRVDAMYLKPNFGGSGESRRHSTTAQQHHRDTSNTVLPDDEEDEGMDVTEMTRWLENTGAGGRGRGNSGGADGGGDQENGLYDPPVRNETF